MISIDKEDEIINKVCPYITANQGRIMMFLKLYQNKYRREGEVFDIAKDVEALIKMGYLHRFDDGDVRMTAVGVMRCDQIDLAITEEEEALAKAEEQEDAEKAIAFHRLETIANYIRDAYPKGKKDNMYPWKDSLDVTKLRIQKLETKLGVKFDPEEIKAAVEAYVASFNGNYKYMAISRYFICKNDEYKGFVSPLLDSLEKVRNGEEIRNDSGIFDYAESL